MKNGKSKRPRDTRSLSKLVNEKLNLAKSIDHKFLIGDYNKEDPYLVIELQMLLKEWDKIHEAIDGHSDTKSVDKLVRAINKLQKWINVTHSTQNRSEGS